MMPFVYPERQIIQPDIHTMRRKNGLSSLLWLLQLPTLLRAKRVWLQICFLFSLFLKTSHPRY